jgi:hypothetical protein
MIFKHGRLVRLTAAALALTLLGAACGDDDDDGAAAEEPAEETENIPVGHDTGAADARTALTALLQEHVFLAAAASNAALGARTADFDAAAAALDANSVDLSKLFGGALGADAEKAFLPLWRSHITMFVNYTKGLAAGDVAARDKALSELLAYGNTFGEFLHGAIEKLEVKATAQLVNAHVDTLVGVIDAMAAKDWTKAYVGLRTAAQHMNMIAEPVATELALQLPDKVPGDAKSPASALRVQLDSQLREHVFLAGAATGAALGGRNDEFTAAAAALDGNSDAITGSVGSVYGQEAGASFGPLWKGHVTMIVNYATGLATGDGGKSSKAVADLGAYAGTFGTALNSLSPELPASAVTELIQTHVATIKAVIDAQNANNGPGSYTGLREAAAHMDKIAEPLIGVIVKQFSDLFPGAT